jgi:hypothetical protein|tara:strand:- start:281 stop:571 length:291 start_codon:yes stop_codon:yes gene_type:complete
MKKKTNKCPYTGEITIQAEQPTTLTIEKNVPFEKKTRLRSLYSRTMDKMEEGDSILVNHSKRCGLFNLASYHGWEIKTRSVSPQHVRVWMVNKQNA